ncbi:MAG: hypothetical protein LAO06_12415 [Acidobacteriia bacterium]|nr:hypothetical protein [Terriglobia bacterium]
MASKQWHIEINKARFNKLRTEERFWQLVALSRAVNALRFVQVALLGHEHDDNSLRATRTRYNSFFFNCALLYEALLLVERLGKNYRDFLEFEKLRQLLKDSVATELRNSSLARLRNQLTFHFLEGEIGAQLAKPDLVPRFASGQGEANADVYYELGDACALGAFAGPSLEEPAALEKRIAEATDLALRFMDSAEEFIVAVLKAEGWEGVGA